MGALHASIDKDVRRINKMEQKLVVVTQGYSTRLKSKCSITERKLNHPSVEAVERARLELECFRAMKDKESQISIPLRLQEARQAAIRAESMEKKMQKAYANATSQAK